MKITIASALLAMSTLFAQATTTTPAPAPNKMEKKSGKQKKSHKKMSTTPAPAVK